MPEPAFAFVYKVLNGETIEQFTNFFETPQNIHEHNTRNRKLLKKRRARTGYGSSTVHYHGASFWNELPTHLQNSKTCNSFKKAIRNMFIEKYTAM